LPIDQSFGLEGTSKTIKRFLSFCWIL